MSSEAKSLVVMHTDCQISKIWNKPSFESISFYLKTGRAIKTFYKWQHDYKGTFLLGSCFFLQFATLSPGFDGSMQFENINIDDISKFTVTMKKSSEAESPAVQESP